MQSLHLAGEGRWAQEGPVVPIPDVRCPPHRLMCLDSWSSVAGTVLHPLRHED